MQNTGSPSSQDNHTLDGTTVMAAVKSVKSQGVAEAHVKKTGTSQTHQLSLEC
jgi:hypothetical protein